MKWESICFISITGKYQGKTSSLAIWFPHKPNGLFIFSRVTHADDTLKYFRWVIEKENIKYEESKSYLFFDKHLFSLPIMTVDGTKQPVYIFTLTKDMTEDLIKLDGFLGQFYHHSQPNGMTTIKFGLNGFTEALGAFNKYCK